MNGIIVLLKSSLVYQFTSWLTSPIWENPAGRVALLTVLAYTMGFSFYGGYLSHFVGGFGSLSFARMGIELGDLVSLFPSATLTFVRLLPKGIRAFLRLGQYALLYIISPSILGFVAGAILKSVVTSLSANNVLAQVGLIMSSIGTWITSYQIGTERSAKNIFSLWFLQFLGILLVILGLPVVQSGQPSPPLSSPNLIQDFFSLALEFVIAVWSIMIIFGLPTIFGREVAKIAITEGVLSRVIALTLKQPVEGLSAFKQTGLTEPEHTMVRKRTRLAGRSAQTETKSEPYSYVFARDTPFYLVDSFHNGTGFYLTEKVEDGGKGKLFVIAREIIVSMVLQRAER